MILKPFLRISITILFLLLVGRVFAEQKYFNHLLDGKGLAQNTVQAMYQDSRGFLWIGTQGGVHLFDGQKFTIFQQSLNSELGLADNYVIDITSDQLGNIWVLSLTGVSKFSFQKMQFEKKIVFGDESEIAFAERLAWSSDGYLILININQIYTFDVNIEKLIEKQEHEFVHHIKKQAGIEFDWFIVDNWLIQNSEDLFKSELPSELAKEALVSLSTSIGVLFLSNDSLYLFSKESGWSLLSKKSDFTQIEPVSMTIDLDGFLWIAGKQGKLIQFDIHSKELTIFGQYETRITDPTFTSVIVTQNNFLWVATASSGVFYRNLSGQNFLFLNNQLPGLETMGQNIRDIESNGEALLIGSDDGLSIYDLKRKLISAFFDTTRVLAILKLSQQRALVSTESGLFIVNMTEQSIEMIKQLNAFEVRSMALLNDMVVLGTRAQGVIVIDADSLNIIFQESLAFQKNIARDPMVLELFVDSHSRLWVGHINGLELWDGLLNIKQQSVINKRIIYKDMIIRDVVEVSPEHFFIASHQGLKELRLLHQNEIEFKEYAQSEGLRDSTIYAISVLDDRYVWFSSNSGLGYLDLFTGRFILFLMTQF